MPKHSAKSSHKRVQRNFNIAPYALPVAAGLFLVLACVLLGGTNFSYLRKLDDLSLFMSSGSFFHDSLQVPGGLLSWAGAFLTQFFYYPWLGTGVFAVLLAGLWWLLCKAFSFQKALAPLAGVAPVMLLLAAVMPGYLIYTMKTPGFPFTALLGFAVSASVLLAYRTTSGGTMRAVVLLVTAALYPLFGFYALFGIVLAAAYELMARRTWWAAAVGVVCGSLVPQLWFYFAESHMMLANAYTGSLPRFGVSSTALWLPYIVVFIVMVFGAVYAGRSHAKQISFSGQVAACSVFGIALVAAFVGRFNDPNFNTFMEMDMAIEDADYAAAVAAARELDDEPTRVHGLYTHLALFHQGAAGDSLFTFPMSDADYASPLPDLALRVTCSRGLNYGFGRINDCYRWCMEDMVEYGPKVEYIKYLAKCSLLNGEMDLARRYIRMLSRTLFHREWARKYMEYVDRPELMVDDPEFAAIRPLMAYNNHIGGDGALIETYISSTTAALAGGPPPLVELSLQFNMIRKNIPDFWPRFMLYARTHDRLPRHYQEAAILFSTLEGKVDWHQFNTDNDVSASFAKFMNLANQNSRLSEDANREIFRPMFGDTYWFYYFFTKGLKTT